MIIFFLTVKNLKANSRYIFRVWAYSILGVGEVSEMIEVNLTGKWITRRLSHWINHSYEIRWRF